MSHGLHTLMREEPPEVGVALVEYAVDLVRLKGTRPGTVVMSSLFKVARHLIGHSMPAMDEMTAHKVGNEHRHPYVEIAHNLCPCRLGGHSGISGKEEIR